jgi:hypothetical protein
MSDSPQAASPAGAPVRPRTAGAGRLKRFKLEQSIVDSLNRGLSVVEIAARVGVGEKRMRAIIREILARRMPEPPEAFVAIQVSRLNEALLVAYSAMTGMNLKAVDRVVRIVRELDRYHGLCALDRRRPESDARIADRGLEAPVDGRMAYGGALVCGSELSFSGCETIAPRIASGIMDFEPDSPDLALTTSKESLSKDALADPGIAALASSEQGRPEDPPQAPEKVDSAPANPIASEAHLACGEPGPAASPPCAAPNERPEIPAQPLEKVQSAPETERPPGEAIASAAPTVPAPAPSPGGFRFCNVRMTPNGIAAC